MSSSSRKKKKSFPKEPDNLKLSYLQRERERTIKLPKLKDTQYRTIWLTPRSSNKNKKIKRISKNTAYKRGRAFEYRVKKHFEKLGYYVKRSYASKGFEDLIAMKAIDFSYDVTECICSEVLLIQCKNLKSEKPLSKREITGLKELAKQCGATPLLASNLNHKLNITEVE